MKVTIYTLKGPDKEYYVGKAVNLARRLYEHRVGQGSEITKRWGSFTLFRSITVEIANAKDGHFAERGAAEALRRELPECTVWGPGQERYPNYPKNNNFRSKENWEKNGNNLGEKQNQ